jgi:thiol:disulfide interchange protein
VKNRRYLAHTLSLVITLTAAPCVFGSGQTPAASTQATTPIAWVGSFESARNAARPNQVIVVDVSTDWCTWCRYMETKVYPDPSVCAFAASNVFVRINPKDGGEGQEFARRQKVKAYPTIFVFSATGKLLQKQVGAFEGPVDFVSWLRSATAHR